MNIIIMQKGSDDNDGDNENRPSRAVKIPKSIKGVVVEENKKDDDDDDNDDDDDDDDEDGDDENDDEDDDDNVEDDGGNALMSLLDISLDLLSLRGKAVTDDGSGASTKVLLID